LGKFFCLCNFPGLERKSTQKSQLGDNKSDFDRFAGQNCSDLERWDWEIFMRIQWLKIAMSLGVLLVCGLALPLSAQAPAPDYAILIVGDEGTAEMLREEKVLINEMAKKIRQQSPDQRLPILSYHFNKERERLYCENKLNVLPEDLLFVGIVKLNNKVPLKVVYRVDRINNPSRAAKDILLRAEEIIAEANGSTTASPSPSPSETPDAPDTPDTPDTTQGASGFRIQLGSFAQLKYAQEKVDDVKRADLEVAIIESKGPDGDTLYKVLSPLVGERAAADELLKKFQDAGFEEAFLTRAGDS
jgi:SPOR domain